jgi:transposase InsO family protein
MEKAALVREYMHQGIKRDQCLEMVGLTKNQFYYQRTGKKPGRVKTETTTWRDPQTKIYHEVDNTEVVKQVVEIKLDPDHANWYRLITCTMQIRGYYINHKKLYRLMLERLLLEETPPKPGRNFVKFRKIAPLMPLQIIEMDIKYVWIEGSKKYAFLFTILDTFTRYVLHWSLGYSMKSTQIQWAWEYVVAEYFQPRGLDPKAVNIEIRSDNGKQFIAEKILDFFIDNHFDQVFTRPYTPQDNGHVESFHSILDKSLSKDIYADLPMLEKRLKRFYTCYNNDRSHSGTKGIPPAKFWALYDLGYLEIIPLKINELKIKLNVAYQDILTIPGINRHKYRVIQS